MKIKQIKAFTLVELLTVVAIIGILTSVAIVGLQEVRKKAQDTTRLSDIKQIQIALETYKSVNGKYPDAGVQGSDNYVSSISPVYINKLPKDPSGTHTSVSGYAYALSNDKKSYCFKILGTVSKASSQKDLYTTATGENTWRACSGINTSSL